MRINGTSSIPGAEAFEALTSSTSVSSSKIHDGPSVKVSTPPNSQPVSKYRPTLSTSKPTPAASVAIPRSAPAIATLASKYAPVFHMHPKEKYMPGDPNRFIAGSSLRQHRSGWFDKTLAVRGKIDQRSLAREQGDNVYIDPDDNDSARRGEPSTAPILYQYEDGQPPTMTYWLFCPYNNKALDNLPDLNHEGDWERVTVVFGVNKDGTMSPSEVRYSAHRSGTALPWKEAPKDPSDPDRPQVYVALGSHAMSPYAVDQPIEGLPGLKDNFAAGGRVIDTRKTADGSARTRLVNVESQQWWGTRARWGERGKLAALPDAIPAVIRDSSSGVTGPMPDPDGNGPKKGKGALGPTSRRPLPE
jgi:hypothetical protein